MNKEENIKTDGTAYKRCLAWRFIAGRNHACYDMCHEEQRLACQEQQRLDNLDRENNL